jgi:hypothetical protein
VGLEKSGDGRNGKQTQENPMPTMTRREVGAAFAAGEPCKNSTGALSSDGRIAYSYRTPIAVRAEFPSGDVHVYRSTRKWSMTTSHHQGIIGAGCALAGVCVIDVSDADLHAIISDTVGSGTEYKIVRMYRDDRPSRTIKRGLNLEQAQRHCNDPRTRKDGEYFDGYDKA